MSILDSDDFFWCSTPLYPVSFYFSLSYGSLISKKAMVVVIQNYQAHIFTFLHFFYPKINLKGTENTYLTGWIKALQLLRSNYLFLKQQGMNYKIIIYS